MPAVEARFTVYRGDTHTLVIEVPGADLVGARIMYVAWFEGDPTNVIEKSVLGGGIVVDADEPSFARIDWPAITTYNLTPDRDYLHELEVRDTFDNVSTAMVGGFHLKADRIRVQDGGGG